MTSRKRPARRRSARARPRRPRHIPPRQWGLPAGLHRDGRVATLREVLDPKVPTIDGDRLTDQQRTAIASERMQQQEHFRIGVLGIGVVDKERALAEMTAGSRLGRALIEIEHRTISLMREHAPASAPTRKWPRARRRVKKSPPKRSRAPKKRRRTR